jgi:2-hydroxychromene-2-carboxylate isomerase
VITIDYYTTLNSPWAFLGGARFQEIVKRHGVAVRTKPSKFGEIFSKTGGLPLAKRAPERQAYRHMELKRWSHFLGQPVHVHPTSFPCDEAPATRIAITIEQMGLDTVAFAREIGRALWERDEDFAKTEVIDAAAKRAGIDIAKVRAAMRPNAELDAIWDANTAEALKRGVFGAPSYVMSDGEFFWGQDRLDFLDRALARLKTKA